MSGTASAVRLELGGKAVVDCVHDRRKRQIVTEAQVAMLGRSVGLEYDSRIHRLFNCACCSNLFFDISDEPRYCHRCRPENQRHELGGPLAAPLVGEITG